MQQPVNGTGSVALTVALLGNPNTGKSTLFTALAGIPTRVGNYPGVTIEEKIGRFSHSGRIRSEFSNNPCQNLVRISHSFR